MRMKHQYELRQLTAFLAVAEEGHFGRAAERLRVAQPALSRTIQQLERALGCRLLDRTTRSVALTPAGVALVDRVPRLLAELDEAAGAALDIAEGRAGRLRIGVSGPAMTAALPRLLRRLQAQRPPWRIDVRELSTSEQLRRLLDRTIDVGFFLAEAQVPDAVLAVAVVRERGCIGVPADHPFAQREALRLGELAGERLILFPRERNPALYDEILALVSDGEPREIEVVEAASRRVAAGLVAAGLGVSTFTEGMRRMCGPEVVLVPQVAPERSTVVLMGWHREAPAPLAALLAAAAEDIGATATTPA